MAGEAVLDALAGAISGRRRIGDRVMELARRHVVDTLGVALAGVPERGVQAAFATMAEVARGGSRSVVSAKRLSPRDAATCNGIAGHWHDFDDDEPHVVIGHPSVAVVAALLAVADAKPLSLRGFLEAYVVGVETMFRVGAVVNPRQYNAGWHCTATLGTLGAAAACSVAMGLDAGRTAAALDVAATLAGGFKENFGSDVKPLQVGAAAGHGLWACELAACGMAASRTALFGPRGFIALLGGGAAIAPAAFDDFGAAWSVESPGINVKLHPCCSSTHTALDALLELLASSGAAATDIERIDVWIGEDVPAILIHDVPRTGLEGKFSMRYCLASAAARGGVALDAFTDEAVANGAVRALLDRVRVHIDTSLPRVATGVTHQSRVRVSWRGGRQAERECAEPRGSAANPCTPQELRAKFLACAAHGIGMVRAERAWDAATGNALDDPASRLLDAV
jgi:2-methylcitrate dehydratase PrpD